MQKEQIIGFIKRNKRVLAGASAAAVILVSFGAFAVLPEHGSQAVTTDPVRFVPVKMAAADPVAASAPRMVENGMPFSFADLVERVSPAVVSVTAEETVRVGNQIDPNSIPDPFREFFKRFGDPRFRMQPPRKSTSMGSGFIISKSGLVVTNNHVVNGATKVKVSLPDGRSFDAKVVGTDAATDVALLKIKADKPLPTVEFGNDRALRVGDWVVAVGNPFGLSNTVTAGIVSSIGRDLNPQQPYTDFIQIDAPINRGNSGGPTFDLRGQVVGMNSMIFSPTGGSVGIGFAIPASTIKDVVAQLEKSGHVARGWLGVQIQSVTPDMAASLGIDEPKGAIVAQVVPDSPAARAGLRQGDVIVDINGKAIDDSHELTRRVAGLAAGKRASFAIVREGKKKVVNVTIGARKETLLASTGGDDEDNPAMASAPTTGKAMGLGLVAMTPDVRRAYNLNDSVQGVLITKVDPDSDAAEKGIQPGDILVSVSNKAVHTPQDVEKNVAAAQSAGLKSVLLLVTTNGTPHFVAVDIEKA